MGKTKELLEEMTLQEMVVHMFGIREDEDEDYQYEMWRERNEQQEEQERLAWEQHLTDGY